MLHRTPAKVYEQMPDMLQVDIRVASPVLIANALAA